MNLDGLTSIALAIVGVALVTTIVIHPASAQVVTAAGKAFSSSITAAISGK
jgi:hypothetical protein